MKPQNKPFVSLLALLALTVLSCQAVSLFTSPTATPAPPPTALETTLETALPSPTPTRQPYGENIDLLGVLDASLPGFAGEKDPKTFGSYPAALDAVMDGDTAYVLQGTRGHANRYWGQVSRVDLSDLQNPDFLGAYVLPRVPTGLAVRGSTLYLSEGACQFGAMACWGRLVLLDVSGMGEPVEIGEYVMEDIYKLESITRSWIAADVALDGEYAYIVGGPGMPPEKSSEAALRVVSVSDPISPTLAGVLLAPGFRQTYNAAGISIQDGYAYLAAFNRGLKVVDIRDPANPVLAGELPGKLGNVTGIALSQGHAYLGTEEDGLQVVDIRDPLSPTLVANYPFAERIEDIAIEGDVAYLAAGKAGVRAIDISDPTNPHEVGYFLTPHQVLGVEAAGGKIYAADLWVGLFILQPTW